MTPIYRQDIAGREGVVGGVMKAAPRLRSPGRCLWRWTACSPAHSPNAPARVCIGQLLLEMDSLQALEGVYVMGATNAVEVPPPQQPLPPPTSSCSTTTFCHPRPETL